VPARLAFICAVAAVVLPAAVESGADPAGLVRCELPGVDGPVLCGMLTVPEDRAAPSGRTISLKVVVLQATGPDRRPDPVVYLAGGGVLPATRYARMFSQRFAALRRSRDIVLVDQRGTGGSNPLNCRLPPAQEMGSDGYLQAVRACRAALEARADLSRYGTPAAMADLDDVRARLGYQTLNVWGMSYGSFAAQVYARSHPSRVRTLALTGPMPLDAPMWLDLARSAQDTLDRVLAECAAQSACRAAYPDPARELAAALDRLAASPATVSVEKPDGSARDVRFTDREFRDLLSAAMYTARGMGDVPHLIHAVFSGDYSPIASILSEEAPPDAAPPRGLFLSLVCSESIPRVAPAAVAAATAGTFVGDFPTRAQLRVCAEWPRAALPEGFSTPVRSGAPLVAIVGALDHTTPPRYAHSIVRGFPNGRVIVLPGRGHNDIDACVAGLIESFVEGGRAESVDAGCAAAPQPLRFRLPARIVPERSSSATNAPPPLNSDRLRLRRGASHLAQG
jgi:pimeloyl-ACP methyl ester carboxylesterase